MCNTCHIEHGGYPIYPRVGRKNIARIGIRAN